MRSVQSFYPTGKGVHINEPLIMTNGSWSGTYVSLNFDGIRTKKSENKIVNWEEKFYRNSAFKTKVQDFMKQDHLFGAKKSTMYNNDESCH